MKIHITNTAYEIKNEVIKRSNWVECYTGYMNVLHMDCIYTDDAICVISYNGKDEWSECWYDEIDHAECGYREVIFYCNGEPTVDIPVKIMLIKR